MSPVRGLGIDSRGRPTCNRRQRRRSPRLTGRADLVRGDYDFAGRSFRLDRGVIRFRGESPPNPLARHPRRGERPGAERERDRPRHGLQPEITFASVPPLPQDELLSRILFGTSITNLSAPEALQLARARRRASVGLGNLDPINSGAPRGRPRPPADRPSRHRHRPEDGDRRRQVSSRANCSSR